MFHAFGYTSGSQEELEPIYGGNELPDPDFKQTCSFKVWIYKGNPYDNYTLSLPATESKMDALKSAMGISNWSECKQLAFPCRMRRVFTLLLNLICLLCRHRVQKTPQPRSYAE